VAGQVEPSRAAAWASETAAHSGAATAAQVSRVRVVDDAVAEVVVEAVVAGVRMAVMSGAFLEVVLFGSPTRRPSDVTENG
jgi:hypothetical protein